METASAFNATIRNVIPYTPDPRREAIHPPVVHLRIAQLIPGNAGHARSQQLQRGPEERRRDQRPPQASCRPPHHHQSQPEQPPVQPQHQAEADQQQRWGKRRHLAIARHGIAHPVAVPHVPKKSGKIAQQERPPQRPPGNHGLRRKHCPDERSDPEPRKHRSPRRHGSRERKWQFQQRPRTGPRPPSASTHGVAYRAEFKAFGCRASLGAAFTWECPFVEQQSPPVRIDQQFKRCTSHYNVWGKGPDRRLDKIAAAIPMLASSGNLCLSSASKSPERTT